ncbi:T9SS type A sorting domain-containing protein [candidate division KSB1 bacterium]|nr:T9SS type A sorting domain-containing protein [candidate division KSB1 bacterium]
MEVKRMSRIFVIASCIFLLFGFSVFAQIEFNRGDVIQVPETDLNVGGTGNMISGMDFDNDGKIEIYWVNDNWNDTPNELIPRIYKLEKEGDDWVVVWKAVAPIEKQNTWPILLSGDLDKDGKPEIIWGPPNNTSGVTDLNPARILVYEVKGDGSDVLGIPDGDNYLPNAQWTITDQDDANIRPMDAVIADPDNDGTDELIFADRKGDDSGYYCGVASVTDIPDNGDGSETWTMEVSGLDFDLLNKPALNKWDVAVIGPNVYAFCEVEITKFSWNGSEWTYEALPPIEGGSPNQSAQAVDLNNDGVMEIIAAVYDWGDDTYKSVYLLEEQDGGLKHTELAKMGDFWPGGSRGPWGSASGDIDGDGLLDFVFGSRASTPNAGIFHFAYKGGAIDDPANYSLAIIDSNYVDAGIWSVINLTDIDDDPQLEVLYTSSTDAGTFPTMGTPPIVVLDPVVEAPTVGNLVVASEILLNGEAPDNLQFKPGRILDNNQTVWFCGVDGANKETWVFRSVDGGKTFTHNETAIPGRAAQMDAFDANEALVATAAGEIYKTSDGGATWTMVYSYTISPIAPGWFDACRVLTDQVAVCVGDFEPNGNMHFVRSEDRGATWTEIQGIDFMNSAYGYYTWGLAGCTVGQNMWFAGLTSQYDSTFVFRSMDAGQTWETYKVSTDIVPNYPRSIGFSSENNGLMTDRSGIVAKSTDGGATWMPTNNPDVDGSWVNGVVAVPGSEVIFGMDDMGVYYTTDLGETWMPVGLPAEAEGQYMTSGVFGSTDFGYVFNDGGLVLRFENMVTSVAARKQESLPSDFQLSQNYPNPFNPTTTIDYHLNSPENVSLIVYNLRGQEIKTLVKGTVTAGHHSVNWDATDHTGQKVPSGMYIYVLKVNNQMLSRRMMLVK